MPKPLPYKADDDIDTLREKLEYLDSTRDFFIGQVNQLSHELSTEKARVRRHHRDFTRVSELATTAEAVLDIVLGSEALKYGEESLTAARAQVRQIRNIVG